MIGSVSNVHPAKLLAAIMFARNLHNARDWMSFMMIAINVNNVTITKSPEQLDKRQEKNAFNQIVESNSFG